MCKKKIVCFGDSLTEGWINGGKLFHPYTKKLTTLFDQKAKGQYEIINAGVSGEKVVREMYEHLLKVLNEHPDIDLLILQGGTNDILTSLELRDSTKLFDEFCKLIQITMKANVKKVCLLTIMEGYYTEKDDAVMSHQESNKYRMNFNEELRNFTLDDSNNVLFCDIDKKLPLFSLSEAERTEMWDDLIHPSIKGYHKMAEIIFGHIKDHV